MPKRRFSIIIGNMIQLSGLAVGVFALTMLPYQQQLAQAFITLLVSWICLWFFPHCLAHYLVGSLVGIRFRYYFVGRSAMRKLNLPGIFILIGKIPVLGIKIEEPSLQKVSPGNVTAMFAAGVLASVALPAVPVAYSWGTIAPFISYLFATITLVNAAFTAYFSPRTGDLFKARKIASVRR